MMTITKNFTQWKDCIDRDFISGMFLWSGIDYLGEASWFPSKGNSTRLIDLVGFKKTVYHFFKSFWNIEPE